MRFVIPMSASDIHMLPDFVSVLEKFGGLEGHRVTLLPQPTQLTQAHEAAKRISALTKNVEVISLPQDLPPNNWPVSCNHQFFFACQQMKAAGVPWMWMELDTRPIKKGWAGTLESEYREKGKAFLGNIHAETGMMVGVAVYHPNTRNEPLVSDLIRSCTEPFDQYLRWAFKNNGYANSEVLCDMWNTVNYRMEGENLVCDAGPDREMLARKRGGIVPASVYIVHGCKDGSLDNILLGRSTPKSVQEVCSPSTVLGQTGVTSPNVGPVGIEAPPKAETQFPPASAHDWKKFVIAEEQSEADKWWSTQSEQAKANIRHYCTVNGNPGTEGEDGSQETKSTKPSKEAPKTLFTFKDIDETSPPPITTATISKKLKSEKMRFSSLATHFGVEPKFMKEWLITNGFEIKAAGWVGLPK